MLEIFNYNEKEIRTQVDENNNPWFCGVDVCSILDLKNVSQSIEALETNDLIYVKDISGGQNRELLFINEKGLYQLIFKSRKASAKKFQEWVFGELLPTLRKTGSYSTQQTQPRQLPPVRDAIDYVNASKTLSEIDIDPRLRSMLNQSLQEEISCLNKTETNIALPLTVLAKELGHKLLPGADKLLGKYVSKFIKPIGKEQHGKYRINVYEKSDSLVQKINEFFS